MERAATQAAALRIEGLNVALPDGQPLFRNASLSIGAGEFVLVVGRSGSGKSTLLRLIAGLEATEPTGLIVEGRVEVAGEHYPNIHPGRVGLVFQSLALFDELSPVRNVEFAKDHRLDRREPRDAAQLLNQLGVPARTRIAALSGGERQRVAVARTLATDAPILLFDEPTTGLDPARAREVSDLIWETYRRFQKTVVIVTHDFQPFLRFAPRLIIVDPTEGALKELDEHELRRAFESSAPGAQAVSERSPSTSGIARAARTAVEWPGKALLCLAAAFVAPWGGWRSPTWKLRYLWHYVKMTALGSSALYCAIAGSMLGFVFITFSYSNVPYSNITLPLLSDEFLAATGYSMFRVVVPLMIAVLMAGKCGASAAADLGARRITQQFEAMRNLNVRPEQYLYGNLVLAMAVGGPLLTLIGFLTACYASLVAYLMTSPDTTVASFRRNFFATMWPPDFTFPKGALWVLLKAVTGGILIAALSYLIGARPKASSVDVSRDVGLTIFWTSLAVLLLHALYSFVEF